MQIEIKQIGQAMISLTKIGLKEKLKFYELEQILLKSEILYS